MQMELSQLLRRRVVLSIPRTLIQRTLTFLEVQVVGEIRTIFQHVSMVYVLVLRKSIVAWQHVIVIILELLVIVLLMTVIMPITLSVVVLEVLVQVVQEHDIVAMEFLDHLSEKSVTSEMEIVMLKILSVLLSVSSVYLRILVPIL